MTVTNIKLCDVIVSGKTLKSAGCPSECLLTSWLLSEKVQIKIYIHQSLSNQMVYSSEKHHIRGDQGIMGG